MNFDFSYNTKPPILLNCWKHHKLFILSEIKKYQKSEDYTDLQTKTKLIGESRMDVYLGDLNPGDLYSGVINYLIYNDLFAKEAYVEWIYIQKKQFREIELTDGSRWTLLVGNLSDKYIHLHPSRYSKHSARIKASTLKTIIFAITLGKTLDKNFYSIDFINHVRIKWLNLPPLKFINNKFGIGKYIIEFLE